MARKTDRRQFLAGGLATGAAVLTGGVFGAFGANRVNAQQFPDLVVCQGQSPAAMTRAAVQALGGMKRFVKPGNKVVIKPNMSFAKAPGSGSNTHPEVVRELARMCGEAGASRILVLDNTLQNPQDCLSLSQIPSYCSQVPNTTTSNVQTRRMFRPVDVPRGLQVKSMEVISEVLDSDVLIAAPVGKSHGSSGVSLSMKGMMGLIYDRRSFHARYGLDQAIVDMVTVLKPNLVVIDATHILSSGGPGGPGKVIRLDTVIASADMVAADTQMVAMGTWYGRKIQPSQVKHIQLAAQQGLGRIDLDKLNIKSIKA